MKVLIKLIAGAHSVILVRAQKSIEDWFLYDSDNIMSFLKLNKNEKITGSNGYDKLQRLFYIERPTKSITKA